MNIVVCIKQVPDPDHFSEVILDPVSKLIKREGIPSVINPADRNAIEAGLQFRQRLSGKVTVLTMGPPQAREALEEALAIGADDAVLLSDRAFAGADTLATAYTLATAIKKFCPFNLILCGNETIDSGTSQVGPQLAEFLDIPHVTNVRAMDFSEEDVLLTERSLGNGYMRVRVRLPALVTVTTEINEPRLPSVAGIMEVATKELKIYGLADLGLAQEQVGLSGSPTHVAGLFQFERRHTAKILRGAPERVAREALESLRELGAL